MRAAKYYDPKDDDELLGEGFVRVADAARLMRISKAAVYGLMNAGKLAYHKFGRSRRISKKDLREYVERCAVGSAQ
jgi:excisionase family DNA binding protein